MCGLCGVVGSHCLVVLRRKTQNNKTATPHNPHRYDYFTTNKFAKCACLPVAIYSTCTPDDG